MARPKPVFATLSASRNRSQHHPSGTLTILACILLIVPPALVLVTIIPPSLRSPILAYSLAVNTGTFLVYRHDKHAARAAAAGGWRVREVTLHLWALAGGWPAAFVAQRVLRHKTRKWRFLAVFWVLVVGEEVLLCLMCLMMLKGRAQG